MIVTTIHDSRVGLGAENQLAALKGFEAGDPGREAVLPSVAHQAIYEDFHGNTLPTSLIYTEGTDTTTAANAVAASILTLTSGDSAGTVAADGAQITSALIHRAANGGMTMVARVAIGTITSMSCFVGFTDTLALEAPIQASGSGNGLTTNATDAVGFMFDTSMTDDTWWATGVKADVDATAVNTTIAPVAGTYEWLKIDVDKLGHATFYRNGVAVARVANAVTPTVSLTPTLIIWTRTTASRTLLCDVVGASSLRV